MLIKAEGFEHYGTGGTGSGNASDGAWAVFGGTIGEAYARNGNYGCNISNNQENRWTFGETKAVIGFGHGLRVGNLPAASTLVAMCSVRDEDNNIRGTLTLSSDGRIQFRGGNQGSSVVAQSEQVIFAGAYPWIESRWDFVGGTLEVRVDNVTVLDVTGHSFASSCSQLSQLAGFPVSFDVDDLVLWDTEGDYVNDFIGDHRCRLAELIADTAQADWVPSVSSALGVEMINEIPPDDANYIEAAEPYLASEFEMDPTPADVSTIAGVYLIGRQLKTEAGDSSTQLSLVNGASEALGTDRPITQLATYYGDAFVVDPETGAPFEPANLGGPTGARYKIARTV